MRQVMFSMVVYYRGGAIAVQFKPERRLLEPCSP